MRALAARAPTAPNPEPLCSPPADPAPIATPSAEGPSTLWARVFAYLDLPPQREVGRDVQRGRPYDGQGWYTHPTGPSRSWRDWECSSFFGQSIIIFLVRASRSPARPSPSRVATVSDSAATR